MGNYHMMIRSEVMRGRYRNYFSKPELFIENKKTTINIKLQDIHHTIKKGHKLQIQVQSTWFPYIDLNPQTFVTNILKQKKRTLKNKVIKDIMTLP
ncbi:MAG: putative acyl esterase [bacterium]|jgi:predicted acyl esterase